MSEIRSRTEDGGVLAAVRGRSILRHDYILPGEYRVPTGVDRHSFLVIMDVGAYCATQHMEFLNIPQAAEVLLDETGSVHLISAPGDELDRWRHLLPERRHTTRARRSRRSPARRWRRAPGRSRCRHRPALATKSVDSGEARTRLDRLVAVSYT